MSAEQQLKRRVRVLWLAVVALAASSVYFLWVALPHLEAILRGTNVSAVCGCETAFAWTNQPWLNGTMIVLGLMSALVLARLLVAPLWQLLRTARFVRLLPVVQTRIVEGIPVVLVDVRADLLFTTGIMRPRIYMSTQVNERFTAEERHAALLHEVGHIRAHHVVKRLLLAGLPKQLAAAVHLAHELAADRYALTRTHRTHVLSALTTFCENSLSPSGAVAFSSTEKRLQALMGEGIVLPRSPTAVLAVVAIPFVLFANSASWANASTDGGMAPGQCLAQQAAVAELVMSTEEPTSCIALIQSEQQMTEHIELLTPVNRSTILHR